MKRRPFEWLPAPEDDESAPYIKFRIAGQWYGTDNSSQGSKAVLPVSVLDKQTPDVDGVSEPYTAIFSQYGGADLILDLIAKGDFEQGAVYRVTRYQHGIQVEMVEAAGDD